MKHPMRVTISLALMTCCFAVAGFILYVSRFRAFGLAFGVPGVVGLRLLLAVWSANSGGAGRHRVRHVVKPQGIWENAPGAEADKSTTGKLLASRAIRDPGVHIVPSTGIVEATPRDGLWDREIDG